MYLVPYSVGGIIARHVLYVTRSMVLTTMLISSQISLTYYDNRKPSFRPSLYRLLRWLALVISLFPKASFRAWTRNPSYLSPRFGNVMHDTEDLFSPMCSLMRQYRFNKFLTSLGNSPISSLLGCIAAKISSELDTESSFSVRLNRMDVAIIRFESIAVSITSIGDKFLTRH